MSLTYSQFVAEIQLLSQFNAADPNFTNNLQSCLDYSQDRIYRELNLINTTTSYSGLALTASTRSLNYAAAGINVLENINIITPAGTTNPELGTRNACVPADKSFLDWVYGTPTLTGIPTSFAVFSDKTLLFGPFPDQNYTVELVGTLQITAPVLQLSVSNTTTFLSTYLPDLLVAAAMIQMSGFMKNFGQQSDNPQMAVSWGTQYASLRDSASVEDARRRFRSAGGSSQFPSLLNPPKAA